MPSKSESVPSSITLPPSHIIHPSIHQTRKKRDRRVRSRAHCNNPALHVSLFQASFWALNRRRGDTHKPDRKRERLVNTASMGARSYSPVPLFLCLPSMVHPAARLYFLLRWRVTFFHPPSSRLKRRENQRWQFACSAVCLSSAKWSIDDDFFAFVEEEEEELSRENWLKIVSVTVRNNADWLMKMKK